jgi:urease accessory protein
MVTTTALLTITSMTTRMADAATLQRLLTWLSPAFPIGAFAWSGGLETAISDGHVRDQSHLENWIAGALAHGSATNDGVLLAESWRAATDPVSLNELAELALALCGASERRNETLALGDAFVEAAGAWLASDGMPAPCPYPIAVGAIAGRSDLPLHDTLIGFFTGFAQAQVSVAVRLVPLGQTDGLKTLAALEPAIATAAQTAANTPLAAIGGLGYAAEISAMRHETQNVRIFRS